jgi:hypothetical protein
MNAFLRLLAVATVAGLSCPSFAATYTSVTDGDWDNVAFGANNPDTGDYDVSTEGADSVVIDGHAVTVNGNTYGGADADPANDRFTVSNGNSVTIRGGGSLTFSDDAGQFAWIGRGSDGTVSIESGSLNGSAAQNLRVGSNGAEFNINA